MPKLELGYKELPPPPQTNDYHSLVINKNNKIIEKAIMHATLILGLVLIGWF